MDNGGRGVGGGSARRQILSEERTDSLNLRDFLRIKEDDNSRYNALAGLTLDAVVGDKSPAPERTLLDIIRDDPTCGRESKKSWKTFRDKLRLKRAGAAWTSSVRIPASDVPIQTSTNRMMMRRESARFPTSNPHGLSDLNQPGLNSLPSSRGMLLRRNTSRMPERQASRLFPGSDEHQQEDSPTSEGGPGETEEAEQGETETGGEGEPPVRMSLMALLAETDRQMGLDGSAYIDDDEDEEDEEEENDADDGGGGGVEYNSCCVCMVRHKGAAFIPCGHTFCRLCSRELWVQRGNCPLCNNFILEILDIF